MHRNFVKTGQSELVSTNSKQGKPSATDHFQGFIVQRGAVGKGAGLRNVAFKHGGQNSLMEGGRQIIGAAKKKKATARTIAGTIRTRSPGRNVTAK